ncbi:MAG: type II toxin-antitoxin system RelE/ParE family toxin [Desulfuromonadales bacterium]
MYTISYQKQAIKGLLKMPRETATKIRSELLLIAKSPYTYAGDFKPLQGREGWRLRIGKYRVICHINDGRLMILVVDAGTRGDIYK